MSEESLVAEREDSSSFWSGTGLGEDISDLSGAISDGSWTQGALAGAGLAGDVVSLAFNPLATAIGAVTGWILEHVHPFPEILDKLAGDADAVRAGSQTWVNISDHLKEQAQDLRNAIKRDMEGQVGRAADAWRSEGADLAAALESLGDLAHSVSTGLGIAGFIVQFVHDMVRDTISEAFGMFCQSVLEEVFSLGLGTPAVVAQISTWVAEKMEVVGRHVDDLISSFEALSKLLRKIEPVTRRLKAFLGHLASAREAPNRFAVRAGHRVGQRINRRLGRSPRSAGSARAAASTSRSAAHASASHDTGGHTSSGHADTSTGHGGESAGTGHADASGGHDAGGHGGESTGGESAGAGSGTDAGRDRGIGAQSREAEPGSSTSSGGDESTTARSGSGTYHGLDPLTGPVPAMAGAPAHTATASASTGVTTYHGLDPVTGHTHAQAPQTVHA
ncbi:MAG: WXG100 family type VII secretion target, partial [Actinomyces sp.]